MNKELEVSFIEKRAEAGEHNTNLVHELEMLYREVESREKMCKQVI